MDKIKRTYIILWSLIFIISLLLIFTLPSIWVYYNGFNSATLQSFGMSSEALATLTKSIDMIEGMLPKNLRILDIAKLASSYITGYVPADFPENNLPVKFWGAVVFLIFSFLYNLWIVLRTLKVTKTNDDAFFNIPIILQSLICLIVSIIVSLYMVINDNIYYVMAVIIYILLIVVTLIIYHSTDLLKSHIKGIDEERKLKKYFIDELTTDCELLLNSMKDEKSKNEMKKLIDEIKYSVSISNAKTENVEQKILSQLNSLKIKIESDENSNIANELNEIESMMKQRNILAKK